MGILGFSDIPPLWAQWLQTVPVKQIVNHEHMEYVCGGYSQSTLHRIGISREIQAPALKIGWVGFLVNLLERISFEVGC